MTPQDEQRIRRWSTGLDREVLIRLFTADDPRTEPFQEFCHALAGMSEKIRVQTETGSEPGIGLSPGLVYRAVPKGPELPPFLSALDGTGPGPDDTLRRQLEPMRAPAFLTLYIAEACPFCPTVVTQLLPFTAANDLVRLSVIDAGLFPENADADRVRSVPTLILDGTFRWTGAVASAEIIRLMVNRDPAEMGAGAMETLIHEGRAHDLARMMADDNRLFPALASLVTHEKWATRLGAIVCAESLAEMNSEVAGALVPLLRERYASVDDTVKGDILYVAGLAGGPEARVLLTSVLETTTDPTLREAAEDAMNMLPP